MKSANTLIKLSNPIHFMDIAIVFIAYLWPSQYEEWFLADMCQLGLYLLHCQATAGVGHLLQTCVTKSSRPKVR